MLSNILDNSDLEKVKEYAMPRSTPVMSPARMARAKGMAAAGYTQAEIAAALGVSISTVTNVLSGGS
jgi:transposase